MGESLESLHAALKKKDALIEQLKAGLVCCSTAQPARSPAALYSQLDVDLVACAGRSSKQGSPVPGTYKGARGESSTGGQHC